MNNEVVKPNHRGPKAFFKKSVPISSVSDYAGTSSKYLIHWFLRIIQWRVSFWHLRSTHMPAVSREVHGTDLKISISFLNLVRHWLVTKNTVLYNLVFIAVNTIMQIAVAIFLTEIHNKHYRKITQSLMFLPYFISWVIVGVMAFNIFSSDYGFMNRMITSAGR